MATEDAGSSPQRSPRSAGKRLAEKRQGFLIYLPPSLHAKLRTEAIRRAVSMSEVASNAIALYLLGEEAPKGKAAPVGLGPFVGRFGEALERPSTAETGAGKPLPPETQTAQAAVPAPEPETYEVE